MEQISPSVSTILDVVNHLITTLKLLYDITIDWTGGKYLGFTIAFNHNLRYVDLSMPG